MARAATPIADSARPPASASVAPVSPASRSLNPSSLPRSHGAAQSASVAVAATNERFQPMPRPNSETAVAATLSTHRRLSAETAITSSPPARAGVRPIRSISEPITSTSAYMPSTWAPMIGNTLWPSWPWWSTTTEPVRVMIPTITAKLAWPATSAGSTPGRRTISPNGAAVRLVVWSSVVCRISPIVFGSGRTSSTSASATAMKATDDHHSSASESPSSSRSASSGLKTSGPRIAPNTAPKSTSAMPRARRWGGYMSPAAVRASSAVPLAAPTHSSPARTTGADSSLEPRPASAPPRPPVANSAASTGTRPKRSIARPAGSAASAPEASTIAGPSPSSWSTPTTSTSVSDATAADSCSIAELAASDADSRKVLRRTGSSFIAATLRGGDDDRHRQEADEVERLVDRGHEPRLRSVVVLDAREPGAQEASVVDEDVRERDRERAGGRGERADLAAEPDQGGDVRGGVGQGVQRERPA